MRWLASRPRWRLAGAFVLVLLGVVLSWGHPSWLTGTAVVLAFLLFFATLMALVARRETPQPPSPH